MVTLKQIDDFKGLIQSKLPGYIIPEVGFNSQKDNIMVSLQFPDSSKVGTMVRITDGLTLDNKEAVLVLSEIIDRSIDNLKSHAARLEQLKYLIASEE